MSLPAVLTTVLKSSGTVTSSTVGLCANIITEFNVELLITNIGNHANPQPAVVGVRFEYVLGSFQYSCSSPNCQTATGPQAFTIRSTATFVRIGNTASLFVPQAPQLIPPLPSDIFYPFQSSRGSLRYSGLSLAVAIATLCTINFSLDF
jgi:hypothetical protein